MSTPFTPADLVLIFKQEWPQKEQHARFLSLSRDWDRDPNTPFIPDTEIQELVELANSDEIKQGRTDLLNKFAHLVREKNKPAAKPRNDLVKRCTEKHWRDIVEALLIKIADTARHPYLETVLTALESNHPLKFDGGWHPPLSRKADCLVKYFEGQGESDVYIRLAIDQWNREHPNQMIAG